MNNNEKRGTLVSYILDQRSKNKTREEITQSLKDSGWTDEEINKGFLDIEEHKERKKKKLWINLGATGVLIVFMVVLLLTGPKSPVKVGRTSQTIEPTATNEGIPSPQLFNRTAPAQTAGSVESRLDKMPPKVAENIREYKARTDALAAANEEEVRKAAPAGIMVPPALQNASNKSEPPWARMQPPQLPPQT